MRNKYLVRFQLVLLVVVAGLVIWRSKTGPARPGGAVVFSDLDEGRLYRSGLVVDRESDAVVTLTASYETDAADAPLATYGWILDRDTRTVAWMTDASKGVRDGVLTAVVDTIHLVPGAYDVFYSTLGPTEHSRDDAPFLGLKPYWTNYEASLFMSVAELGAGTGPRALIAEAARPNEKRNFDRTLWATGPVGNRAYETFLFRVSGNVSVRVYAIGEMCPSGCDYGWVENVRTGEKAWQLDWDNSTAAGGTESNRVFDGTIALTEGIYRAVFRTNGRHSARSWAANPPFDPDGWGMTLYDAPQGRITEFDPWDDLQPILRITQVGDDQHRMNQIRIVKPTTLLLYAVGEITTRGSLYDYGWLESNETGETIWKMSRENSLPAGGDGINRVEMAFVDLSPGTYTLHFQTDSGHSFEGWVRTKPSHPERWGVTVFPVDGDPLGDGSVELTAPGGAGGDEAVVTEGSVDPSQLGKELVSLEQVGNDADLFYSFSLDQESEVYIVAQGEISPSGSWDYGWIEQGDTEERVWEMTLRNTMPAGGADRNRRFEGSITLPAGAYTARYVSDFSHAYEDFDDEPPTRPNEWGMKIYQVVSAGE